MSIAKRWWCSLALVAVSACDEVKLRRDASCNETTTELLWSGNLKSNSAYSQVDWDIQNPAASSPAVAHAVAFGNNCHGYPFFVYVIHRDVNHWEWHAVVDGAQTGGSEGDRAELGFGLLNFDTVGVLMGDPVSPPLSFTTTESGTLTFVLKFGDGMMPPGPSSLTQYGSATLIQLFAARPSCC